MVRPRTFEPEEALDKAMAVFWRKGYAETSYDDLVSETGVSRKGLYTVFGDKEALFIAALHRYCRVRIPEMFHVLDQDVVTLAQIEAMFNWLTDLVATGQLSQGCFMANTAAVTKNVGLPDQIASNWELDGLKNTERWWFES